MDVHCDYEDLFKVLNDYRIKYLVVGAYAVMYHTQPRYTKDIDVWIITEMNDVHKIFAALKTFGAPLQKIEAEHFYDKTMIFQIGLAPVRIDIMTAVPGITFKTSWQNKKRVKYGQTPIYVLGKKDLIAAKEKAGRPQDKIDVENLRDK